MYCLLALSSQWYDPHVINKLQRQPSDYQIEVCYYYFLNMGYKDPIPPNERLSAFANPKKTEY